MGMLEGLLPETLKKYACIAGGYAACPGLASDLDVWVAVPTGGGNLAWTRKAILAHLIRKWPSFLSVQNEPVTTQSPETDIFRYALIAGFDISTHQIALTRYGVVKADTWTPPHIYPKVLIRTATTEGRLRKIAARYGHSTEDNLVFAALQEGRTI